MIDLFRRLQREVLLLAGAQALFQTAAVLQVTVAALAGERVSDGSRLATLPSAAVFLGTALATIPASVWMARVGRRAGFMTGAATGITGGLVAASGVATGSLWLLALGTFLFGIYQAFAQFYRFAAAETVPPAQRSRAIGWVLGGGIVAAVVGPRLASFGSSLLETRYVGSFLILSLISVAAAGVLWQLRIPDVAKIAVDAGDIRPLGTIVRQPRYLVALFGAATGYGVMVLAMTATPLAMEHHHHDLSASATVIQLHVLGMFLPSFFTGSLIARFGVIRVMLTGVALLTGHVLTTLTGTGFTSFAGALMLLGVGWNFLYIGGTALLTGTYTEAERGRAQAANDMMIFVVGLGASLTSGALLDVVGWQPLNVILLPWLALAAAALFGLGYRDARAARIPVAQPAITTPASGD